MPEANDILTSHGSINPESSLALRKETYRGKFNFVESLACTYITSVVAAVNAELITYPLDLTKTRLQIQGEAASKANQGKYRGMWATAYGIAREEGIFKLWRGMTVAVYRHMIYSGVRICTYDYLRKELAIRVEGGMNFPLPLYMSGFCAVVAGCLAQWLASPAAVVKVLLQMEGKRRLMGEAHRVNSPIHALQYIVCRGGIKALWTGSVPNVQRAALVNLGDLTTYDVSKRVLMAELNMPDGTTVHVLASICAGFVATCMGTPADVIKTRIMNQPVDRKGRGLLYRGSFDCMYQTVTKEGISALYKGFMPLWIRLAPWALIFWVSFEKIRSTLGASGY